MKILVVDDDPSLAFLMKTYLEPYGEADTTDDGDTAVEMFTKALNDSDPYELVCMDVMMPRMNGIDAVAAMRKIEAEKGISEERAATIITITVLDEEDVVNKSIGAGANSYLTKDKISTDLESRLEGLGIFPLDDGTSDTVFK